MVLVILIVFEYKINRLYGSIFDLYTTYQHFKKLNYKIKIITDIIDNYIDCEIGSIQKYFGNEMIDEMFFDELLKNKRNIKINNNNFISILEDYIDPFCEKNLVYYSGHGKNGKMILPDNKKIAFQYFLDSFNLKLKQRSQLFFIFDCCESGNLLLPFEIKNNIFHLKNENYYYHYIFLITSSYLGNSFSIATQYGSLFTKLFFKEKNNYDIDSNIQLIKKETTKKLYELKNNDLELNVSVYSSYIFFPIFWTWVFESKYYITPDYSLNKITISTHD